MGDVCDPTFGDIYVCTNPKCERKGVSTIIHTCSQHPPKKVVKCSKCRKPMIKKGL